MGDGEAYFSRVTACKTGSTKFKSLNVITFLFRAPPVQIKKGLQVQACNPVSFPATTPQLYRERRPFVKKQMRFTRALALLELSSIPLFFRRLESSLSMVGQYRIVVEKALDDALHIAIATVNNMDYLVTWNQTHIFNPDTIEKLYSTLRKAGYKPSVLVRPDNLLEKKDGS